MSFFDDVEANAYLDARASGGPDREVGLSLTVPEVVSGVLVVTEPVGASYARVALPASAWAAASDRQVQTSGPVIFASPLEDLGIVQGWFLTDAAGVPRVGFRAGDATPVPAGAPDVYVVPRIFI